MFPGQCGNTAFFFKSQPDQFHFEFRGIVFPGKSFFSAHEVSTCKISGCLSYRILDSGPDGTQTTLTNNLVQLHNLRTLSVSSPLKTTDGVPLAYLSTNVLRKTNGEIAKGVQNATLTVRKDAAFGIKFNGAQAAPGESVEVQIDMGQGDNLLLPVYPSENGKVGTSEFMIQIDELK